MSENLEHPELSWTCSESPQGSAQASLKVLAGPVHIPEHHLYFSGPLHAHASVSLKQDPEGHLKDALCSRGFTGFSKVDGILSVAESWFLFRGTCFLLLLCPYLP